MPTTLDDLAQQVRLLRAGGAGGDVEGGEIVAYNSTTGIATIVLDNGDTVFALLIPAGGGGASSPLTTKGDVWGYSTVDARIPVGADDTVLTADSGTALGVSWQTASGGFTRATVTKTTASLADTAQELSTVTMAKTWMLTKVVADRACRIRLYTSTTARGADAARGEFVEPTDDAGCVFDLVLSASVLTWHCVPNVTGSDDDSGVTANIPITIDNLSGSTHTIAVTFTFFALES